MERNLTGNFTNGNFSANFSVTGAPDGFDANADKIITGTGAGIYTGLLPAIQSDVSKGQNPAGATSVTETVHVALSGVTAILTVTANLTVEFDEQDLQALIRTHVTNLVAPMITLDIVKATSPCDPKSMIEDVLGKLLSGQGGLGSLLDGATVLIDGISGDGDEDSSFLGGLGGSLADAFGRGRG